MEKEEPWGGRERRFEHAAETHPPRSQGDEQKKVGGLCLGVGIFVGIREFMVKTKYGRSYKGWPLQEKKRKLEKKNGYGA